MPQFYNKCTERKSEMNCRPTGAELAVMAAQLKTKHKFTHTHCIIIIISLQGVCLHALNVMLRVTV